MAALNPCKNRAEIKSAPFGAIDASSDVIMTLVVPIRKIRFRPTISAMRPKTSTNIALAIKKAIGTQPRSTASRFRSSAMVGNATLVADNIRGVVNAFNNTITNAACCTDAFSRVLSILFVSKYEENQRTAIFLHLLLLHFQGHSLVL